MTSFGYYRGRPLGVPGVRLVPTGLGDVRVHVSPFEVLQSSSKCCQKPAKIAKNDLLWVPPWTAPGGSGEFDDRCPLVRWTRGYTPASAGVLQSFSKCPQVKGRQKVRLNYAQLQLLEFSQILIRLNLTKFD